MFSDKREGLSIGGGIALVGSTAGSSSCGSKRLRASVDVMNWFGKWLDVGVHIV
jgi:hypothetical protein